ncbi:MAG: amidohydrolase family protein [Candidatus Latescibacteria bacterium]|nr:amidohydrolase family protein [Candidatus Latescibacterota bacterium]
MIIDFHGHVGRWDSLDMVDDPAEMLRAMDAVGIDKSCVFNIFHPDGQPGNDQTAAFIARHPDRFIGFAYVCPTCPDTVRPELERAIDELGFRAIKIYPPYTPFPLDDSAWDPIYSFAAERGLAVLAHTGGEPTAAPAQFGRAAARFPNARFVAGHSGNTEPYRSQAIAAAQRLPNYFLETCSTFRTPGQGRGRPRALRLGHALDGPPPPARQDHHRGH